MNIPDNYVAWTIKNQKALPPIGWNNWWRELNYLSLSILTITPTIALIGAYYTRLRWETAVWSVLYYFVTGLGMSFPIRDVTPCAKSSQESRLVTTVSGLTGRIMPPSLSSTHWRSQAQVPLRAPLSGGREDTARTIVTPTLSSTPTMHTRASGIRTSAG